ncbi:uncharacterized protein PHALS_01884 [Plasmopara halstedii]|uniref:Uncharacterized protein n=1 Tax=Plasmopara halstedii TaxID=4781 RepID=A0A0P1AVX2_PLAHL|nr:uncharacterized protein PHALS_01884 [Plasmopara halstedii]CEG45598.1 hypothetical protein PHALS_01884 [Plasmopara halstedii]|eukprot:XP_024581967.1 hypothetical protein PHALS_01884 [Plasmopara halstedii]
MPETDGGVSLVNIIIESIAPSTQATLALRYYFWDKFSGHRSVPTAVKKASRLLDIGWSEYGSSRYNWDGMRH